MPQLYFKKPFQILIREGRKTTTLRRWPSCRLVAGDRVYAPGVGWLQIRGIDEVSWESLTDADARADGFASMKELTEAIRELYPNQDGDGRRWYRIRFTPEQPAMGIPTSKVVDQKSKLPELKSEIPNSKTRSAGSKTAASNRKSKIKTRKSDSDARAELALVLRAELDKAIRQPRSFPVL
jgi:uncharacterized protein YqfB (UPF0267 family)